MQPTTTPEYQVGIRIDMLFNYGNDNDINHILMWSQVTIQLVFNGSNIPKEGSRFHKKGDAKVL